MNTGDGDVGDTMRLLWPCLAAGVESAGAVPEELLPPAAGRQGEGPGAGSTLQVRKLTAPDQQVPLPLGKLREQRELFLMRSLGGGSQGTGWCLGRAVVL